MNRVRLEKMTFLQLINDDICPFGKTVFFPEVARLLCLQSREARNHKAGEWNVIPRFAAHAFLHGMESTLISTVTVLSDKNISWLFSSDSIWAKQYSVHTSDERR